MATRPSGDNELETEARSIRIFPRDSHAVKAKETIEPMGKDEASDSTSISAPTQTQSNEPSISGNPGQSTQAEIAIDDAPFSVWTTTEKKLIIFTASLATFFSPVSGQIYFPALDAIATDLNVSYSLVNLSITTYMASLSSLPSLNPKRIDNNRQSARLCRVWLQHLLEDCQMTQEDDPLTCFVSSSTLPRISDWQCKTAIQH
jgi:hypothetical protein